MQENLIDILYSISITANKKFKLEQFLNLILEKVSNLLEAKRASLMLKQNDKLIIVAVYGIDKNLLGKSVSIHESIAGTVAKLKEITLIDFNLDEWKKFAKSGYNSKSAIIIPLIFEDELLGILNFAEKPTDFTQEDLKLAKAISFELASSIKLSLLYENVNREKERLNILYSCLSDIANSFSLEETLNKLLVRLQQHLKSQRISIILNENDNLILKAGIGIKEDFIGKVVKGDIVDHVFKNQKPLFIANINEDSKFSKVAIGTKEFKNNSLMAVPLIAENICFGVITATNKIESEFTNEDFEMFKAIANATSVTILKNMYYEQMVQKVNQLLVFQSIFDFALIENSVEDFCLKTEKLLSKVLQIEKIKIIINWKKNEFDFDLPIKLEFENYTLYTSDNIKTPIFEFIGKFIDQILDKYKLVYKELELFEGLTGCVAEMYSSINVEKFNQIKNLMQIIEKISNCFLLNKEDTKLIRLSALFYILNYDFVLRNIEKINEIKLKNDFTIFLNKFYKILNELFKGYITEEDNLFTKIIYLLVNFVKLNFNSNFDEAINYLKIEGPKLLSEEQFAIFINCL